MHDLYLQPEKHFTRCVPQHCTSNCSHSQYDNALKAAHVLMRHNARVQPSDAQTSIILRDMADNVGHCLMLWCAILPVWHYHTIYFIYFFLIIIIYLFYFRCGVLYCQCGTIISFAQQLWQFMILDK